MTGIAGYVHRRQRRMDRTIDKVSQSLCYTDDVVVDKWKNDRIGVCRVHHGVTNRLREPIFNKNRSMFLLMDGEVFDERETQSAGSKNDSESDNATHCLNLYEKLKDGAFKQLNGSFSLAIYDFVKKELLLVTDRFCSRPLFYSVTDDGSLFFGSKLSSVLVHPKVRRDLHISSIFELLTFQMILGTKTLYENIHVVPSGSALHYRDGHVSLKRYWQLQYKAVKRSEKFYVDKLAETLKHAVEIRTGTNCRYGLLLSGGLDSRTVLAAATKKLSAFTVCESRNREVRIAREVTRVKGCRHIILTRPADHYIRIIDKAVELSDGLYAFVHAHCINFFERIREESDILLHGCKLDNFQGFTLPLRVLKILGLKIHTAFRIDSYLSGLSENDFLQAFLDDGRFVNQFLLRNSRQVFTPTYSVHFEMQMRQAIREMVKDARERGATRSDVWDHIISWHAVSKQRVYLSVSHVRAFMPERTVMFDNALFDLYLEMPSLFKRNGKVYRKALKKLNERLAIVPNSNTGFSPQIPHFLEWIIVKFEEVRDIFFPERQVQSEGSYPNHAELLRQNVEYQAIVEATIKDSECLDPSIFNTNGILQLFKDHLNRRADHFTLLSLILTFGRWQKKFGALKSPRNKKINKLQ